MALIQMMIPPLIASIVLALGFLFLQTQIITREKGKPVHPIPVFLLVVGAISFATFLLVSIDILFQLQLGILPFSSLASATACAELVGIFLYMRCEKPQDTSKLKIQWHENRFSEEFSEEDGVLRDVITLVAVYYL